MNSLGRIHTTLTDDSASGDRQLDHQALFTTMQITNGTHAQVTLHRIDTRHTVNDVPLHSLDLVAFHIKLANCVTFLTFIGVNCLEVLNGTVKFGSLERYSNSLHGYWTIAVWCLRLLYQSMLRSVKIGLDLGLPAASHNLLDSVACISRQSNFCDHKN